MTVVLLTNFLTHHQTPFCDEMYKKLGDNFHLIVMRSTDEEQKNLGYKELNELYPYVVRVYESEQEEKRALKLCEEADAVIFGSADHRYIEKRLQQNKLTFIYAERLFKKSALYALLPNVIMRMHKKYVKMKNKKQYYLCASAYTSKDINMFTKTPDKFFKWGYFPKTNRYKDVKRLIEEKKKNSIIWVARYIDWKHPEIPVEIGKRLKKDGYDFEITMIGNGIKLDEIKQSVKEQGLEEHIHILGSVPSDSVREYMEKSQIHIFTSDRNEGWGAVLNESMNSACAVVANHAIGSVPFLIKDSENGLIYKDKDIDSLYKKVKWLLENSDERKRMSESAYKTIVEEWNAENAAQKIIELSECILGDGDAHKLFNNGVCSKAAMLKDNWYN